jgi:hypothetical protein
MSEQRPANPGERRRPEDPMRVRQRASESGPVYTTMPPTLAPHGVIGPYHVYDTPSRDMQDGPTHQPGVFPGGEYAPLRTPFGDSGVPGAGRERNVTDLDLTKNQHPARRPAQTSMLRRVAAACYAHRWWRPTNGRGPRQHGTG